MSDLYEILFTTSEDDSQKTCSTWDPRTGTNLMTYKGGGATSPHGLSTIKNEFIITANSSKPLIHIWPINDQEQVPGIRYVAPGKVNTLSVSPDGNFLVAGIQESIYIWEICSGTMLNLLSKHYQSIKVIKFTDDGSHFISAGEDGSVIVWNLTICSKYTTTSQEPTYIFNDHALSVTDICVGKGGMRAMLCTISVDRTCKIYDLASGNLLLNLVFAEPLTSVTMDILETCIYTGTSLGTIYNFSIISPPRTKEYHMTEEDYTNKFLGHSGKTVTTLSLSLNGKILCSGGQDNNVYLWDISSKQLVKTIPHKGAITNVVFTLSSKNMFNTDIKFNLIAGNLKRMMETGKTKTDHIVEILVSTSDDETEYINSNNNTIGVINTSENVQEVKKLRNQLEHFKKINKQLFDYSIGNILNNS